MLTREPARAGRREWIGLTLLSGSCGLAVAEGVIAAGTVAGRNYGSSRAACYLSPGPGGPASCSRAAAKID